MLVMTGVLNAIDAHPNDIHRLPDGSHDISSSFALRWWVFSSEAEKFKWFSFDLALNENSSQSQYSVLLTRPSQDASVTGPVLETS